MTTLLLMTDGRKDCFKRTLASLAKNLHGDIHKVVVHDDSGDIQYAEWLRDLEYKGFIVHSTGQRSGFAGAIRSAWSLLDDDYIIHWEDDFVLNRHVDVKTMQSILERDHGLAQIALLRQPWNELEIEHGGIVECDPAAYTQRDGYFTHRKFFTTNPCMYRGTLIKEFEWPEGEFSEGKFGLRLWRYGYLSAYLGRKFDAPLVTHIGETRLGNGY